MTGGPTSARKVDHLRICCEVPVESGDAGFGDVRLVHNALPECDMDRISTTAQFLGHRLGAPMMIAAMTGGHADATPINARLAAAAERFGLGIGVGSERAALEDPSLAPSYPGRPRPGPDRVRGREPRGRATSATTELPGPTVRLN